jgi:hypothetical protein
MDHKCKSRACRDRRYVIEGKIFADDCTTNRYTTCDIDKNLKPSFGFLELFLSMTAPVIYQDVLPQISYTPAPIG